MKKWVVAKGWEGFGDRLQCLSYCIDIAIKHNRELSVDWTDSIWKEGFYRYFEIEGLPNSKPKGDCYPEFWDGFLKKAGGEWLYNVKDAINFELKDANGEKAIWVHPCIGGRAWNFYTLAKRLKIVCMPELKHMIKQDCKKVVHLRGTDREPDYDKFKELATAHPDAAVVSDDLMLANLWLAINPAAEILTDTLLDTKLAGHKRTDTDKHQMNLRLIADFITLAFATEAYALNEESEFFKMARLYGSCSKEIIENK